jgi:hypothetical protein
MNKYMRFLGLRVKDRVTGFTGVVSSICFDLYGCVQAAVSPPAKDEKLEDGRWFDLKRLDIQDETPVMELPSFSNVPGGAEKSQPPDSPIG